jgi:hypothetical protein
VDVAIDMFGALLGLAGYAWTTRNRVSRTPV